MKDNLKLFLKYIMRFALKLYWVFPIRRKTVFFMANMGKAMLCNPKYIYESMIADERFDAYHFIWCFLNPEQQDPTLFSENTKLICKKKLVSYFYYLLTSEIIVYNCGGFSYAPIRKKQYLIETWHGGGASKRVGLTVPNKSAASKKGISIASRDIKLFLSSSAISSKYMIRDSLDYHGEILNSGFPRNDLLFSHNPKQLAVIREKLHISENAHVALYAPTFKGDESRAVNVDYAYELIDPEVVKRALEERFGGSWLFLTRGHQYANDMRIENTDGDVSAYPDMQEILLITDVLITDYSSSIWDFAITGRPCFLFTPDLKNYEENERGFLTPIQEWPGVICENNQELKQTIIEFSREDYITHINIVKNQAGSYETGNACNLVKERILEEFKELL